MTLCNSQKADSVESNPVKPLALVPGKENVWLTYAMTYHLNLKSSQRFSFVALFTLNHQEVVNA